LRRSAAKSRKARVRLCRHGCRFFASITQAAILLSASLGQAVSAHTSAGASDNWSAGNVQVFGRRHHEQRLLLRRPASKKRQGTKSRVGLGGGRQRALWGFDCRAGYGGGREAGARRPG